MHHFCLLNIRNDNNTDHMTHFDWTCQRGDLASPSLLSVCFVHMFRDHNNHVLRGINDSSSDYLDFSACT